MAQSVALRFCAHLLCWTAQVLADHKSAAGAADCRVFILKSAPHVDRLQLSRRRSHSFLPPLPQVAYESWHIIWAVTGVVGFIVLAFPEALNIVSGIKARRSGATQPLRAGGSGAFAKDSPGASASEDSGSKPVSSYTATAI